MTEQTAVVIRESEQPSLLSVIQRIAENPQADIEKLERLVALHERTEAKRAETAFNAAMSEAQADIGRVSADRQNNQTRSVYATYAAIDREVRPVYTKNGFALSFNTGKDAPADMIRLLCTVSHCAGFSRDYSIDMPADGKGAKGGDVMTKTHAAGSATTYGMRYLLKMIFNIAIGDDPDDDDGNRSDRPDPHQAWIDKIDGITDALEAQAVRAELKAGFAGTPPAELVRRWKSVAKNYEAAK